MGNVKGDLTKLDIEALEWRILCACRKAGNVAQARAQIEHSYKDKGMSETFTQEIERIFSIVEHDEKGFYLN